MLSTIFNNKWCWGHTVKLFYRAHLLLCHHVTCDMYSQEFEEEKCKSPVLTNLCSAFFSYRFLVNLAFWPFCLSIDDAMPINLSRISKPIFSFVCSDQLFHYFHLYTDTSVKPPPLEVLDQFSWGLDLNLSFLICAQVCSMRLCSVKPVSVGRSRSGKNGSKSKLLAGLNASDK